LSKRGRLEKPSPQLRGGIFVVDTHPEASGFLPSQEGTWLAIEHLPECKVQVQAWTAISRIYD
jgi:hypothetical protein